MTDRSIPSVQTDDELRSRLRERAVEFLTRNFGGPGYRDHVRVRQIKDLVAVLLTTYEEGTEQPNVVDSECIGSENYTEQRSSDGTDEPRFGCPHCGKTSCRCLPAGVTIQRAAGKTDK